MKKSEIERHFLLAVVQVCVSCLVPSGVLRLQGKELPYSENDAFYFLKNEEFTKKPHSARTVVAFERNGDGDESSLSCLETYFHNTPSTLFSHRFFYDFLLHFSLSYLSS